MTDYTQLKGVGQVGETMFMSTLENNLKTFFDWGMLGIGGWYDINAPATGAWGGNFHTLRLVDDPSYTAGQVWEAPRKDFVWETGVSYLDGTGVQPVQISGVSVGGTLYGTGDSTYGHHVNYQNGRIVFDSAISTSSTVTMNYSHRTYQFYIGSREPWWQQIQRGSFAVEDAQLGQQTSGEWGVLSHNRVQLPSVIIESVPRRESQGYQLGDDSLVVNQDVLFHIIAESRWDRNQMIDILTLQDDKTIWLYNETDIIEDDKYPLDYRGSLVSSPIMYPNMVSATGYRWKKCTFQNSKVSEIDSFSPEIHQAAVRVTFEVII
jgi:hypothetical protein